MAVVVVVIVVAVAVIYFVVIVVVGSLPRIASVHQALIPINNISTYYDTIILRTLILTPYVHGVEMV